MLPNETPRCMNRISMKPTNDMPANTGASDAHSNCTCCRHSHTAELPSNLEWEEERRAARDEDREVHELPPTPTPRLMP